MKRFFAMLLALSLLLSLTVCVQAEPVVLTDMAGREVSIEAVPERIVSGYYISTSTLIALGLSDKLVGIEAKADKRPIYKLSAPQLIELPNVGTAKEFNLEGCLALEPDLVILPLKLKSAAQTLEELGIDVLLVNPESQEQLMEMIALLGDATGTADRAGELADYIQAQQAALAELLADADAPTVYLGGNSALLSTAGQAMYQSDMIVRAGGVNVADEIQDTYWVDISYEQLLAWDPDYIILASDASYTAQDVLADENLKDCTAVKNGNVFHLPADVESWDSPVPSGFLGSCWMASILHGDLVTESDCTAWINEFYGTFYGFTLRED